MTGDSRVPLHSFSRRFISHKLYKWHRSSTKQQYGALKDRQLHGGECAGGDVFTLGRSVQRGFRGTAVDFGQRVLQQLNGGQNLWTQMRESNQVRVISCICHSSLENRLLHFSVTNQNEAFKSAVI